jgi:hypothetical protein
MGIYTYHQIMKKEINFLQIHYLFYKKIDYFLLQ